MTVYSCSSSSTSFMQQPHRRMFIVWACGHPDLLGQTVENERWDGIAVDLHRHSACVHVDEQTHAVAREEDAAAPCTRLGWSYLSLAATAPNASNLKPCFRGCVVDAPEAADTGQMSIEARGTGSAHYARHEATSQVPARQQV